MKVPQSWITKTKKLVDTNRKVDIRNRYKLAKHLKLGADKYKTKQIKIVCSGILEGPMISGLIRIAKAYPVLPDYALKSKEISWSHIVACASSPDLLKDVVNGKMSISEVQNKFGHTFGGAKVKPDALKVQADSLTRKLKKLNSCPKVLRNSLDKLIDACIETSKLPT